MSANCAGAPAGGWRVRVAAGSSRLARRPVAGCRPRMPSRRRRRSVNSPSVSSHEGLRLAWPAILATRIACANPASGRCATARRRSDAVEPTATGHRASAGQRAMRLQHRGFLIFVVLAAIHPARSPVRLALNSATNPAWLTGGCRARVAGHHHAPDRPQAGRSARHQPRTARRPGALRNPADQADPATR